MAWEFFLGFLAGIIFIAGFGVVSKKQVYLDVDGTLEKILDNLKIREPFLHLAHEFKLSSWRKDLSHTERLKLFFDQSLAMARKRKIKKDKIEALEALSECLQNVMEKVEKGDVIASMLTVMHYDLDIPKAREALIELSNSYRKVVVS